MPLESLPGWVIDNDASVRREVAPFRDTTMAERWTATRKCAHAAHRMLGFNPDPDRVLGYRDPLPESTIHALERLRAARDAA